MREYHARLEHWRLYRKQLVGHIFGDEKKRFPDGQVVRTSTLENHSPIPKEGVIVQTRNTRYLLGKKAAAK